MGPMSDAPSEHTANAVRRARSFIVVMGVVAMFGEPNLIAPEDALRERPPLARQCVQSVR